MLFWRNKEARNFGIRLKSDQFKALTKPSDGKTIFVQQIDILKENKTEEIIIQRFREEAALLTNLLYIAGGGAIGALLRYFLSGAVHSFTNSMYPWGTLAVNLAGSFIAGFVWCFSEDIMLAPHVKTFIFIGILGAFTTFSTYMLETLNLFRDGETGLALYNLLLNNFLGIIVVFSGFFLSQALINLFKQG